MDHVSEVVKIIEHALAGNQEAVNCCLIKKKEKVKVMTIKPLLISAFLALGALSMQGCSSPRTLGIVDHSCPAPSKDQLNKDGYLMLQNGITLKCQVKNNTSRMACFGAVDGTGDDAWFCDNGTRKSWFLFDEKGILKAHKL